MERTRMLLLLLVVSKTRRLALFRRFSARDEPDDGGAGDDLLDELHFFFAVLFKGSEKTCNVYNTRVGDCDSRHH